MKVVANKTLVSFSKRLWNVFEALSLLRNVFEIAVFCLVPHAPIASHRAAPIVTSMIVCVPYNYIETEDFAYLVKIKIDFCTCSIGI